MTRIKICGLVRTEDAELAVRLGADELGFVLEPSSPRCVTDRSFDWIATLGTVPKVAVFAAPRPLPDGHPFDVVQSFDLPNSETQLRHRLVIRIPAQATDEDRAVVLNAAARGAEVADSLVLDTRSTRGYGGTGEVLDWSVAAEVVRSVQKPVFLAGGLTSENVREAIEKVRPYGVDVSSGVERSPGVKDPAKLEAFVRRVRG